MDLISSWLNYDLFSIKPLNWVCTVPQWKRYVHQQQSTSPTNNQGLEKHRARM